MKSVTPTLPPLRASKILDQLRERIRYLHYSLRTEEIYVYWVRAYIRFHGIRHPATMAGPEIEAFLSWLANARNVSASTHRQALSALLFLYEKVLDINLPWLTEIGRLRIQKRLPVVLVPEEVAQILAVVEGEHRLFGQLLSIRNGSKATHTTSVTRSALISLATRDTNRRSRPPDFAIGSMHYALTTP